MYLKKIMMMKKGYVQVQCFLRVYFVIETVENFELSQRKIRKAVGNNGTHAFFTRVSQMFKSC